MYNESFETAVPVKVDTSNTRVRIIITDSAGEHVFFSLADYKEYLDSRPDNSCQL